MTLKELERWLVTDRFAPQHPYGKDLAAPFRDPGASAKRWFAHHSGSPGTEGGSLCRQVWPVAQGLSPTSTLCRDLPFGPGQTGSAMVSHPPLARLHARPRGRSIPISRIGTERRSPTPEVSKTASPFRRVEVGAFGWRRIPVSAGGGNRGMPERGESGRWDQGQDRHARRL
jgi:hypothetical protein